MSCLCVLLSASVLFVGSRFRFGGGVSVALALGVLAPGAWVLPGGGLVGGCALFLYVFSGWLLGPWPPFGTVAVQGSLRLISVAMGPVLSPAVAPSGYYLSPAVVLYSGSHVFVGLALLITWYSSRTTLKATSPWSTNTQGLGSTKTPRQEGAQTPLLRCLHLSQHHLHALHAHVVHPDLQPLIICPLVIPW